MWGHREETAIRKPRKEASGETNPSDALILDCQPPDWEGINFCCLNCPVCGILLLQPEQTHTLIHSDLGWLRRRWVSLKPTYPEAGKQHSEPFPRLKWDGNTELKTVRGFWDVPKALAPRSSRWFVLLGIRRGRPSLYMGNRLPQREWQAQNGRWESNPATPISPK